MQQLLNSIFSQKKYFNLVFLPALTLVLGSLVFITPAWATGVYQIPNITSGDRLWVLDQGEVISRVNESKIANNFANLADKSHQEIRFVTIHRLDYGETPTSFTKALFQKWFPTSAEQANQTLLVLDTVTNGTAIISGQEAQSLLTESIAESVRNQTLGIPIRDGNKYNQGFLDASDRLIAVLGGEPDPGPPTIVENVQVEGTFTKAEDTDKGNATVWVVGLLIAATIIPMATYYIYQVNQPSSDA